MRKISLLLIALCVALLWVGAVYADDAGVPAAPDGGLPFVLIGDASNPNGGFLERFEGLGVSAQSAEGSGEGPFGQFAEGCPQFFEPQRFPATGQTTSYVAGDDGDIKAGAPLRYRDNHDGTITDENTKLVWEKKDQASGGLHNWNNAYPWSRSGNIFDWVAQLNAARFASHSDWRIPNVKELQSIVDYGTSEPAVDTAFNTNCTANCTVDGADNTQECSCTHQPGCYWSGTTVAGSSVTAWVVTVSYGMVTGDGKAGNC